MWDLSLSEDGKPCKTRENARHRRFLSIAVAPFCVNVRFWWTLYLPIFSSLYAMLLFWCSEEESMLYASKIDSQAEATIKFGPPTSELLLI